MIPSDTRQGFWPSCGPQPRSGRIPAFRVWIATAIALGSGVAWSGWRVYHSYPLRDMPPIDLSNAATPVRSAISNARAAVVASPRSGSAWGRLAMTLRAHGFDSPADACLAQAMRFDPHEFDWLYLRGSALLERDRRAAEQYFRQAAQLRPGLALPRMRLGELYLNQGRLEEARDEFQEAIRIEPENPRATLGMGLAAFSRGDLEVSREWAEKTLALIPQQRTAMELLLRVYRRLDDKEAAVRQQQLLEALPSGGPDHWDDPYVEKVQFMRRDPEGRAARATVLIGKGRLGEAIDLLESLAPSSHDNPQLHAMLAQSLIHQKNYRRAEQVLKTARERYPDSAEVHFLSGAAQFFNEEWEAAALSFRRAKQLKPNYSDAAYNLGHVLIHLDDRAGAIAAFREAIWVRPDYAAAYTNLGKLLLEAGEREAGREALETAARLAPQDRQASELLDGLK